MPPKLAFPTYILPSNFLSSRRRRSSAAFSVQSTPTSSAVPDLSTSPTSSTATSPQSPSYLSGATNTISCSRCHVDFALTSQIISKGFTGRHGRAYLVAASPSQSLFTACPPTHHPAPRTPPSVPLHESSETEDEDSCSPTTIPAPHEGSTAKVDARLPNTYPHRAVHRNLVTGAHVVSDIACAQCHNVIGWRYIHAEEEGQKYKVGKYILETRRTSVGSCWDSSSVPRSATSLESSPWDGADETAKCKTDDDGDIEIWGGDATGVIDEEEDVMFDSQDEDECEALFAGMWSPGFARSMRRYRI